MFKKGEVFPWYLVIIFVACIASIIFNVERIQLNLTGKDQLLLLVACSYFRSILFYEESLTAYYNEEVSKLT